jgi:polyisoprenoid-binding protein YceI
MRQVLQRRGARIGLALAVGAAVLVVAGIAAALAFVGGSPQKAASGPVSAPTLVASKDSTLFTIDASGSDATFTLNEVLFGQPNTVVGKTSSVAGQILVNRTNAAQSQVGEIKVDLSTLVTDSDLRNRQIQNHILETSDPSNQYATFVATSLNGLPSGVTVGQPISFRIVGNLTIHGVTRSVTFDARVTEQSATELTGQAQTTIRYADFGISIPQVPTVTGVSDTVVLALTFTAKA